MTLLNHNTNPEEQDVIDPRFVTDEPEKKRWLRAHIKEETKKYILRGKTIKLLVMNKHSPPENLPPHYEVMEVNDIGTEIRKTNRLVQSSKAVLKMMHPDKYYSVIDLKYKTELSENKVNEVLDFLQKEQYIESRGGNNATYIKIGDLIDGH